MGLVAILLWSTLAALTTAAPGVPPWRLMALGFLVGGAVGLLATHRQWARLATVPAGAWAWNLLGLGAYHALYLWALRHAPPLEAGLLNYLWPLLMVLFSSALPGHALRAHHLLGAVCGLLGTAALLGVDRAHAGAVGAGHGMALGAAVCWAAYSVGSRRWPDVPTVATAACCVGVGVLAVPVSLALEGAWEWPRATEAWVVVALGAGPLGLAFLAWDRAVRTTDLRTLGALSYLAPVLSSALLWAVGAATLDARVLVALGLVLAGAWLARRPP